MQLLCNLKIAFSRRSEMLWAKYAVRVESREAIPEAPDSQPRHFNPGDGRLTPICRCFVFFTFVLQQKMVL